MALPLDELLSALTGVDHAPPPQLDPFLDAASRCFARFGITRTSVRDVAGDLGVDRTTVYRQVGTASHMLRLLAARDLRRMAAQVETRLPVPMTPAGVVQAMAAVIEEVRSHPVLAKLLSDEPQSLSLSALNDFPPFLAQAAAVLAPVLEAAMESGQLARRDPRVLAGWLIRLTGALVLLPPAGDLEEFLSELLLPVLIP